MEPKYIRPEFKVGNGVKDHAQVQYKLDTGEVAKPAHISQGPFQIKIALAKISMMSISIMIQHMVYVNTKGVNCIYFLQ